MKTLTPGSRLQARGGGVGAGWRVMDTASQGVIVIRKIKIKNIYNEKNMYL